MRTVHLVVACAASAAVVAALGCAASGIADNVIDDAGTGDDGAVEAPRDAGVDARYSYDANEFDSGGGFDAAPAGDGGDDGGNPAACAVKNTCLTANDMGSISGDTGSDSKAATGFASEWLKVFVTENDTSIVGRRLRITATLASPPGANFDLYLYVNAGGSPTDRACTSVSAQSTNATGTDTVSLSWGEGAVPNGKDDSRIVSVEVRYVGGTCSPSSKWTLTVVGN